MGEQYRDEMDPRVIPSDRDKVSRVKVILVVLLATLFVSVGETLLSVGMKKVDAGGHSGFGILKAALLTPQVVFGTLLMTLYFGMYAMALGWADISFVLPFTAMSYLFVAILAKGFLHENVTPTRWMGTVLIILGVIVVGLGERGSGHG